MDRSDSWKRDRRMLVCIAVMGGPIMTMSYFDVRFLWVAIWMAVSVFLADRLSNLLDRRFP